MAKKTTIGNDLFLDNFAGEIIRLTLKTTLNETEERMDEEGGVTVRSRSVPMLAEGFLIDTDDNFFYLGAVANDITHAIPRDQIAAVELYEPEMELDQLMDMLGDEPKDPKDFN